MSLSVFERLENVRVQIIQQIERVNQLARMVKVAQPALQGRAVMWIAGETVRDQSQLLVGRVVERKRAGNRVDLAVRELVFEEIDMHFAANTQRRRGLCKGNDGDGIRVEVAQPAHGGFRLDVKSPALDMHIVPLAGPHQRAMGTERDRLVVIILRRVVDADAFHGSFDTGQGGWVQA